MHVTRVLHLYGGDFLHYIRKLHTVYPMLHKQPTLKNSKKRM